MREAVQLPCLMRTRNRLRMMHRPVPHPISQEWHIPNPRTMFWVEIRYPLWLVLVAGNKGRPYAVMASTNCATCDRLSKFYTDCVKSIQRLKEMAQAARDASNQPREGELLETIQSLEAESFELLAALTGHQNSRHHNQTLT